MRVRQALVPTVLSFVLLGSQVVARATQIVGTFNSLRSTTANFLMGDYTHEAQAAFDTNFPNATIESTSTLTTQFLSGINTLVIGSPSTESTGITPLSTSEQSALLNFVLAGGNAFLIADGYIPYTAAAESFVKPFGMTIVDDGLSGVLYATPTTQSNPVINGPFGDVTTIPLYGAGIITNLGPYATTLATMNALNKPVLAEIPAHALGPTSGRVLIVTNAAFMMDDAAGGFFSQDPQLFLNAMNYALTPEPTSLALATVALAGFAVAGMRGRFRHPSAH
ncbi:MAG TPA: hypothetical protein VGN12_08420 [Pirellulales bacterium]|jgi:hypothetical protein